MAIIKQDYGLLNGGGYEYPSGTVFDMRSGSGGTTVALPCEGINIVNLTPNVSNYNYTITGVDEDGVSTIIFNNTTGSKTNVDISNYKILQIYRNASSGTSGVNFTVTVV